MNMGPLSGWVFSMILASWALTEARTPPSPPVTDTTLFQVASSLRMYVDELPLIPKLFGYTVVNGVPQPANLTIGMYKTTWKFHRDLPVTTVFAYGASAANASVPGPTIEAIQNIPTYVTWENFLPQSHILPWDPTIPMAIPKNGGVPTVVHLHGGISPPQSDGHPLAWFTANFAETGPTWTQRTYTYPNTQHAGNLWYHDHTVGLTRVNLLAGLIAPYIIRNVSLDARLNLPLGPVFDRVLMIFDRSFNSDGSLYMNSTGVNPTIHPQWQPEYFGDAVIVNGKAWPYLRVERRRYRFRIINTSNARFFRLSLTNNLAFTQIGSDGSYLPNPVATQAIVLGPAEGADVVVDFSTTAASESVLTNDAPYPYPGGNAVDQLNSKVMKFIIQPGAPSQTDHSHVPPNLKTYPIASNAIGGANTTRYITLYEYLTPAGTSTHLYINGLRFEDPVTETPRAGTTEVWEVINLTSDNHPFHMHLAAFQAVKIQQLVDLAGFTSCMTRLNDAILCNITSHATGPLVDVPPTERTWKNVVKMAPGYKTTLVVQFFVVDNAHSPYPFDPTAEPGYVYHCHFRVLYYFV
ncbi:multicopper oxidase LPR1 homolog 1-like isoform X2 [Rhodamnia argentea]|uniref:Multicopper oxidase LPR1 homolog 1-like isoform X2 n=1 Tax=Rhodamnia argentea TaxID=178133 RepID=A0A8B8PS02_9MYRT|nr:multicopper oxidase LPR1 homolog 1-like isoform X2 [Rhodamnia argentea]